MNAYAEIVADLQVSMRREEDEARQRLTLYAMESVDHDGFTRVSWYTTQTLTQLGLIEPVPDDKENRYRLTVEGRIMLHANPVGAAGSDDMTLFGTLP